jgi:hypothetical protein
MSLSSCAVRPCRIEEGFALWLLVGVASPFRRVRVVSFLGGGGYGEAVHLGIRVLSLLGVGWAWRCASCCAPPVAIFLDSASGALSAAATTPAPRAEPHLSYALQSRCARNDDRVKTLSTRPYSTANSTLQHHHELSKVWGLLRQAT